MPSRRFSTFDFSAAQVSKLRIMSHGADWRRNPSSHAVFGIIRALRGRRVACHSGDIGPVTVTFRSVTSPLDRE
jgi:hypothetical protein